MDKYNGVRIDCEYLGALADDALAGEHGPEQHRKYIANPFRWSELVAGGWSSQRLLYAKWTVHTPDGKSGHCIWQGTTSERADNLLDQKRYFPEPTKLPRCRAICLPDVAAMSARKAMEKYNGVSIDCEYLGHLQVNMAQSSTEGT